MITNLLISFGLGFVCGIAATIAGLLVLTILTYREAVR